MPELQRIVETAQEYGIEVPPPPGANISKVERR
jgi:hypothetical protein